MDYELLICPRCGAQVHPPEREVWDCGHNLAGGEYGVLDPVRFSTSIDVGELLATMRPELERIRAEHIRWQEESQLKAEREQRAWEALSPEERAEGKSPAEQANARLKFAWRPEKMESFLSRPSVLLDRINEADIEPGGIVPISAPPRAD